MSTDRPNLLQRLDILPAAIRQRDDNMGRLHLLVEHLLEYHSRTERYVVAAVVVELRGDLARSGESVVVVGEGELLTPAPHTFGTRDGWISCDADLSNL